MSDEPKKQSRPWAWICWAALVLFVLYPLSSGPARMLVSSIDNDLLWNAYYYAYRPLFWGAETLQSDGWVNVYVMWWDRQDSAP